MEDTVEFLWDNNNETWNNEDLKELLNKSLEDNIYFSIEDTKEKIIWQLQENDLITAKNHLKDNSVNVALKKSNEFDKIIEKKKELSSQGKKLES